MFREQTERRSGWRKGAVVFVENERRSVMWRRGIERFCMEGTVMRML